MGDSRRLCLAVDIEGYSRRSVPRQRSAQSELRELLDHTWRELPGDRQPNGDGEVTLAPSGADDAAVLGHVIGTLRDGLRRIAGDDPPRLRLAAHAGHAEIGANGFVGHAVVRACRMVDSSALRRALADHPDAGLAVMVSETLYEDAVCREGGGLRATDFRAVEVAELGKGFVTRGFVHVPRTGAVAVDQGGAIEPDGPRFRVEVAAGGHVGTVVQVAHWHGSINLRLPGPPGP